MDPHQDTRARFETTSWSLVLGAQSSGPDLDRLLGLYWPPVYAYIRRSGRDRADAADLTQEFLSTILLERDLIGKARADRGRFRTFLQSALRNFLVDQHRRSVATRRAPKGGCVSRDPQELAAAEADESLTPDEAFECLWATRVLGQTLERVEAECRRDGMDRQWRVFDATIVAAAVRGTAGEPLADLAREAGVAGPEQVSNMVQTIKRRFRRALREVLRETVESESEIDDEMRVLRRVLN